MTSPARIAAYEILLALETGRSDLPSAIAHTRQSARDPRDHALASEISIGVERRRATLDHLVTHFAARPIDRLDIEILTILRLSLYQLLFLTRVPASAAVDDGVALARRAGKSSAVGFVNAVLREVSRQRLHLPLPARPEDPADRTSALDYLSITLSHPRWLAARWLDRLGFGVAEQWMEFNNRPAPLTLRANRLRVTPDDLTAQLATRGAIVRPGHFAPDALILESGEPLVDGSAEAGSFVIQDEASQLVTLLAGLDPGTWVLDACAAPGGKTTALAAAAGRGRVVACDIRDRRMALLRRTVAATGPGNAWLVQANLLTPLPFRITFDCVLVDAPCSGLGTLRRDPDIRWRRQETDLSELAGSQLTMLRHAAAAVRAGGRLVYATCSSEPEENEDVAAAFLRESPQFAAIDARYAHPALPAAVVDDEGHLRTCPDRHGLEAFFGAVFERRSPHL